MNNYKEEYVYRLLYSENKEDTKDIINSITDSKLLHMIAGNINYDDGFAIPYNIINNNICDLGTALMIFYDADGYSVLDNREELIDSNFKEWHNFILEIEKRILHNDFKVNNIKFVPPLTKVQIYKLKNNNPNINKVFITESDGEVVEIPNIQFIKFLEVFASGQICHDEALEDMSAQEYLLTIASWLEDMDGYYKNSTREVPKNIDWNFIANILFAGKMHEMD